MTALSSPHQAPLPDVRIQIHIQVFSDPICPWCYIGHKHLRDAIESYPRAQPEITLAWRTFMLNPGMPAGGMDRQAYLNRKFGGAQGAAQVYGRIAQTARDIGLNMRLDDIRVTPETRSAHQVIQALQSAPDMALSSLATPFVHRLFRAYFEEIEDIGLPETLDRLVAEVGGPVGFAAETLEDGTFNAQVIAEDQHNRARGLTGVPGFLVQNQHFVGGAQPVQVFHRLFDIVVEEAVNAAA